MVVAVAGFTLALNAGDPREPVSGVAPGGNPLEGPSGEAQYDPLVSRMLADLMAGREPESQDKAACRGTGQVGAGGPGRSGADRRAEHPRDRD
jgi:hypothetical protein